MGDGGTRLPRVGQVNVGEGRPAFPGFRTRPSGKGGPHAPGWAHDRRGRAARIPRVAHAIQVEARSEESAPPGALPADHPRGVQEGYCVACSCYSNEMPDRRMIPDWG